MSNSESPVSDIAHAKTHKRLIAMVYDAFLVFAVLMFAAAIPLFFTGGEAMSSNIFMTIYLILVQFLFFAWFWTRSGQTLGMQSWRLQLVTKDEELISWQQALLRFVLALPAWSIIIIGFILLARDETRPAGSILTALATLPYWVYLLAGLLWLVIDNRPNNWREKISATRVIQLPKSK